MYYILPVQCPMTSLLHCHLGNARKGEQEKTKLSNICVSQFLLHSFSHHIGTFNSIFILNHPHRSEPNKDDVLLALNV